MKLLINGTIGLLTSLLVVSGGSAFAKEIVKDVAAKKIYDQLFNLQIEHPSQVTSYINTYFGDADRPHLGKLWVTTIYPASQPKTFCYEYDFRDVNVKEYLCEIYP